jgi:hypothetical protein
MKTFMGILFCLILFGFFTGCNKKDDVGMVEIFEQRGDFEIYGKVTTMTNYVMEIGCISDEICAKEISFVIFQLLFDEDFNELEVTYDENNGIWIVKSKNENFYEILLEKRTAEVISIKKDGELRSLIIDENCAEKIAFIIFKSICYDGFDSGLPLMLKYDEDNEIYLIKNQVPEGLFDGGVYMIMKKSNAEIIAIWADLLPVFKNIPFGFKHTEVTE